MIGQPAEIIVMHAQGRGMAEEIREKLLECRKNKFFDYLIVDFIDVSDDSFLQFLLAHFRVFKKLAFIDFRIVKNSQFGNVELHFSLIILHRAGEFIYLPVFQQFAFFIGQGPNFHFDQIRAVKPEHAA